MTFIRKTLGRYAVTIIPDGTLQSSTTVFKRVAPESCQLLTGCQPTDILPIPTFVFLLETPDGRALIDAGAGRSMGETMGHTLAHLATLNVRTEDIRHILLTHNHRDHSQGLTMENGEPAFPAADIVMHRKEFDFWSTPMGADVLPLARNYQADAIRVLAPYNQRIRLVDDGDTVLGLKLVPLRGHTPGHSGWLIDSLGERALLWGDTVHSAAIQVPHPEAVVIFDVSPDEAAKSRIETLSAVADNQILIAGSHIESGNFARVIRNQGGFLLTQPG